MQILTDLHERRGQPLGRLVLAMELKRSTVWRWLRHIRLGQPAIKRRGRAPLKDMSVLQTAIAKLRHGLYRSRGAPALWRSWQASISRFRFNVLVRAHRQELNRQRQASRIDWKLPGAVWAMDPAHYIGGCWNMVTDLASRFRFDLMLAVHLPTMMIVEQLYRLFERYGAPLVLKRDNGSNLVTPAVNELLAAYGVLPLTSPMYYPRYNGSVEYAQRETKRMAGCLIQAAGLSPEIALAVTPGLLNARPRPCLGGQTAQAVFLAGKEAFQSLFTINRRREVKDWIINYTWTIIGQIKDVGQRVYDAAWRQAVETWMQENDIIEVRKPVEPLPHFP